MTHSSKFFFKRIVAGVVALVLTAQPAFAATLSLAQSPLYVGAGIPPYVMLNISKDQQIFKRAYNDYSDLDGDGIEETTYKHSISYYGYFDSFKCYDYVATNSVLASPHYVPFAVTADKYCTGANAGKWSGNFLNWGTMTRMDAIRKLLYGGMRVVDSATTTVLERSYLPTEAHAFAKYYGGTDIAQLTPFNLVSSASPTVTASTTTVTLPTTTSTNNNGTSNITNSAVFTMSVTSAFLATARPGAQLKVAMTATPTVNYMLAHISAVDTVANTINVFVQNLGASVFGAGTSSAWTISNLSSTGISMCNLTLGSATGVNQYSDTNTNPPIIRVAQGDFGLWNANERWQCKWFSENNNTENGFTNAFRSNGNRVSLSGLNSSAENPDKALHGLGSQEYVARVEACVTGLFGTEKCKEYNQNGFSKPIGLLQVYGDPDLMRFGLVTGSYHNNQQGGVLRKNVGPLSDEINISGDGTFYAAPASGGIINTLNKLRITGYDYSDGTFIHANDGSCNFQLTAPTNDQCRSWGNPMGEFFHETIRYFAGATSATPAFTTDDSNLIAGLTTAPWPSTSTQVLNNNNYCTPLNVLIFNPSVTSYDNNAIGNPFGSALPGFDATAYTNTIGTGENIGTGPNAGTNYFIGSIGAQNDSACTAKTFNSTQNLGNAQGLCSEAPTLGGTYRTAGLAYAARTNRIRSDLTVRASDTKSLKINTYGVSLATNVPRISVAVPGTTGKNIIIQPAYRLDKGGGNFGTGALVDMKIVKKTSTSGTIYLNWEDSNQGGDYDQDMWGMLSWSITPTTITITTNAVSAATANGQGFGYIVSGTTQDGPHFHSGIYSFTFNDTANVTVKDNAGATLNNVAGSQINTSGGCVNCVVAQPPTSVTYTIGASGSGQPLQDPLWYAAKWGGFNDLNGNGIPDQAAEWDVLTSTGTSGSDGVPDNYFLVTNPLGLEASLDKAFTLILTTSSSSSVATNSTSLNTGSKIYQARFNPADWSGQVLSYSISTGGAIATNPDWDAGQVSLGPTTVNPNARNIITSYRTGDRAASTRRAIPFRWPGNPASPSGTELQTYQTSALQANPLTLTTNDGVTVGQNRLNYLRGDATNEGIAATDFRRRTVSKLGDTVASNPNYVAAPSAGYPDSTYSLFRNTNINRKPVVYAGASDGMLHAFDASATSTGGTELFAYVPNMVYRNLSQLTSKTYVHRYYVDGSPEVQDAKFTLGTATAPDSGNWSTVLVAGLGGGGQGVFALDVTNPSNFTESSASSIALWEFSDLDDPDVGNVYGDVSIRKMNNGKWAAIFGSGFNNSAPGVAAANAGQAETDCTLGTGTILSPYLPTNCTRSLTGYSYVFVVYLSGPTGVSGQWVQGTDYFKIPAGTVGSTGTPNGLVSPFPLDADANGTIDYLYAGDINGNLWKFDVSSSTASNWTSASNQKLLFTAKDASNVVQPITTQPVVAKHISGSGYMINFGTGKYLETTDASVIPSPQSYYGIWDKADASPISGQTAVSSRSSLMPQWILNQQVVGTSTFRVATNHQPNYGSANRDDTGQTTEPLAISNTATTPPQLGWVMDFPGTPGITASTSPATGERVAFDGLLQSGRLIFTSLLASTAVCDFGGSSFLMALNNQTVGRFVTSTFDTNGDNQFSITDLLTVNIGGINYSLSAAGAQSSIGITPTPTILTGGGSAGVGGTITVGSGSGGGVTAGTGTSGGIAGAIAVLSGSGGGTASMQLNLGKTTGRLSWREVFTD